MKNLLWVGDCACSSGFGRASHYILDRLRTRWNVSVIGVNYRGDPQNYPYPIYPAWPGGDPVGFGRLRELIGKLRPNLIVFQCNPWNIPHYHRVLSKTGFSYVPTVGIIAVEGKNCSGEQLNTLRRAIFWTEFGKQEAIVGGMVKPCDVVPLGVDTEFFTPGDREEARKMLGLPEVPEGAFILGNVNRNQYRKRIDLSIIYFAEWVKNYGIYDAYLYLHVLPGSSVKIDCQQLAKYYGVHKRLILAEPKNIYDGAPEEYVRATYRAFDVQISTTLGEGWGLTTMEGMACGIPQIAGDYSALAEWGRDAIYLIPCNSEGVMPDVNGMIGSAPSKEAAVEAIDALYKSPDRLGYGQRGLERVRQPEFNWNNIADRFAASIEAAM